MKLKNVKKGVRVVIKSMAYPHRSGCTMGEFYSVRNYRYPVTEGETVLTIAQDGLASDGEVRLHINEFSYYYTQPENLRKVK